MATPPIDEPYYQIPKPIEPYYQVPKSKPESLYENVAIVLSTTKSAFDNNAKDEFPINMRSKLEPPKEKPPPPPIDEDDGEIGDCEDDEAIDQSMKRNNSTRRIKKEIRSKRSSFLGIEDSKEDEMESLLALRPSFDDKRLRQQNYMKAGLYSNSDTSESRDSGVSENHSRQGSEEYEEVVVAKKDENAIEPVENWPSSNHTNHSHTTNGNDFANQHSVSEELQVRYLEGQIREQEEVLRVERELLQIEQEELKRQRENLLFRRNLTKREMENSKDHAMPNHPNRQSLDNIHYTSSANYYVEYPIQPVDYRQSMPNLNVDMLQMDNATKGKAILSPIPPAKPMRANQALYANNRDAYGYASQNRSHFVPPPTMSDDLRISQNISETVQLRNPPSSQNGNMNRNTIHALSAVPKPKLRDGWVHSKNLQNRRKTTSDYVNTTEHLHRHNDRENFNYNAHWLIQEAEQRRIDQQRGVRPTTTTTPWQRNGIMRQGSNDDKPLPEAVIKTITQRVQSKGLGERKRWVNRNLPICVFE